MPAPPQRSAHARAAVRGRRRRRPGRPGVDAPYGPGRRSRRRRSPAPRVARTTRHRAAGPQERPPSTDVLRLDVAYQRQDATRRDFAPRPRPGGDPLLKELRALLDVGGLARVRLLDALRVLLEVRRGRAAAARATAARGARTAGA